MTNDIFDLIQSCTSLDNLDELIDTANKIATHLEFDHVAFGLRKLYPTNGDSVSLLNTYSDEWDSIYISNNLVESDPVASYALHSAYPFLWSDLKSNSTTFWNSAREFGLNVGWSKPTQHPLNTTSLISFSRSSIELGDKELNCKYPLLLWASSIIEQKFIELSDRNNDSEYCFSLTCREKEVLKWSAMGKTVHEISIILGVSERTVTFHINNSIKKLNAGNKTSAVAKAIIHKLIY
jgi:LuxR family transcriptional regulator, quorum-sensing system regulator SolR